MQKTRVQKIPTLQWGLSHHQEAFIHSLFVECQALSITLCVQKGEGRRQQEWGREEGYGWLETVASCSWPLPYPTYTPPRSPCPQVPGNEQCMTTTTTPSGLSRGVKCTHPPSGQYTSLFPSKNCITFLCAVATLHPQVCNNPS